MVRTRQTARRNNGYGYGNNQREEPNEDGFFDRSDNILVRIAGIHGGADVEGFEDCIEVMSFSWNLAQQTTASQPPVRVRRIKAEEKKRRFLAAGLTEEGGLPEPEEEEIKDAAKATESGSGAAPKKRKAPRMTEEEFVLTREAALDGYASDDFTGIEFADSEVSQPKLPKAHIGEFTITMYNGVASPQLYQMILGQKAGVEAQIILVQERAKKVDDSASSSSATPAAVAAAPAAAAGADGDESSEAAEEAELPAIPRETVVMQEWKLRDVLLSNVSISGGSGGRPCETLSLSFGSFDYRFVDWAAKRTAPEAQPSERAVAYDRLRNKVAQSASSAGSASAPAPAASSFSSSK